MVHHYRKTFIDTIRMFSMNKSKRLETLYHFYLNFSVDPRISNKKLHRCQTIYKSEKSTSLFINDAFRRKIIISPTIYCNSGIDAEIYFHGEIEDPIGEVELSKNDKEVTRAVALFGEHSFLCFRKGASILTYAEAITPTLESDYRISDMELTEKGKLPIDSYPNCWDELDWKIYDLMRNPRVSFSQISGKLKMEGFDVTWKTVENRYKKIVKDCKVWVSFFPGGMQSYSQTFLTFKTDFECSLRKELQKMDRTSYLYKIENRILLNLFLENNIEHRIFVELKKKGLIRDLHVSMPVHFWTPLPI
jgi:hypothetical protein